MMKWSVFLIVNGHQLDEHVPLLPSERCFLTTHIVPISFACLLICRQMSAYFTAKSMKWQLLVIGYFAGSITPNDTFQSGFRYVSPFVCLSVCMSACSEATQLYYLCFKFVTVRKQTLTQTVSIYCITYYSRTFPIDWLIVYSGIHKNMCPTGATPGRIKCASAILITINKSSNKTNY